MQKSELIALSNEVVRLANISKDEHLKEDYRELGCKLVVID